MQVNIFCNLQEIFKSIAFFCFKKTYFFKALYIKKLINFNIINIFIFLNRF